MLLDEFLYKIGFNVDKSKLDDVANTLNKLKQVAQQFTQPLNAELNRALDKNQSLLNNLDNTLENAKNETDELKQKVEQTAQQFAKINNQADKTAPKIAQATKASDKQSKSLKSQIEEIKNKFFLVGMASTILSGLITKYLSAPLENIDKLASSKNQLFKITNNQIQQAKEYNEGMAKTKEYITSITTQTALKLLPVVNEQVKGFNNFLTANKNLVVDGLTNVFKWIVKLGQVFMNTFRALNALITNTIGYKGALLALIAVLALVKRASIATFITSPIGLVVSAIIGLMLLLDDLFTYLDGGKSLFGDLWKPFIKWCDKAKAVFKTLKPYIMAEFEAIKQIISGVLDVIIGTAKGAWGLLTGDFDLIKEAWEQIWGGISEAFDGVATMWKNSFKIVVDYITFLYNKYIAPIVDTVKGLTSSITDAAKDAWDTAKGLGNDFLNFLGVGDDEKVAPQVAMAGAVSQGQTTNSYDIKPVTNVNIQTNNKDIAHNTILNAQKGNYNAVAQNLKGGFND
ncbi:hypothetical protein [Campylobacter mucosalis]|uniref:hypothetical protein n=1 Tax=Campylobacter mucosalis TaxID=202 RepID=UPI0014705451|nr:hypothetical protein [Campylobacter mucosalis]